MKTRSRIPPLERARRLPSGHARRPLHPLRPTVFVPRCGAYATAALLVLLDVGASLPALAYASGCLLLPWAQRRPLPLCLHGALRNLELLAGAAGALAIGATPAHAAAIGVAGIIGTLCVHGPRAGATGTMIVGSVLLAGLQLSDRPALPDAAGAVGPLALVLAFCALIAALAHLRGRRLEHLRREFARRAREDAACADRLSCFVPEEVRRQARGALEAERGSRRRWLTVCFADLVGFTALTDAAESEETVALLDDFYAAMDEAARAHGGTLDKFMGDGVMVFFDEGAQASGGEKAARGASARACLSMALQMQDAFDVLRERWRSEGVVRDIGLRVGMHSGWCTVGVFGPERRRAFTVIGSTVNIASRLEAAAEPGRILLSHTTFSLLGDRAGCCRRLGPLRAKGLRAPIETFQALRQAPDAPMCLRVDGLEIVLHPELCDPVEARAALERALSALPFAEPVRSASG